MKKGFIVLFILMMSFVFVHAQDTIPKPSTPPQPVPQAQPVPQQPKEPSLVEKRINIYGIYTFDDSFSSSYDTYNYYEGKIKGGIQFGAGIEFMVKHTYGVELLWIGQNTKAPTTYAASSIIGIKTTTFDLNLNYAMLGFGRHFQKPGSSVEGYSGLMVGALFAGVEDPESKKSQNGTKFAWGARLGLNVWASEKLAIKLQGQLLSAVQSVGGGLYFGTGGAGAGLSTYSTMLQFGIGGGVALKL
jgi:hypothetical protein